MSKGQVKRPDDLRLKYGTPPHQVEKRLRQRRGTVFTRGQASIPLTNGEMVILDATDYKIVKHFVWRGQQYAGRGFTYAVGSIRNLKSGKYTPVAMHRLILGATAKEHVDHKNGNGLDNRRGNLRLCSIAENVRNQHARRGVSRYKGVTWCKQTKKWYARIKRDRRSYYLGRFSSERTAALAYDQAALRLHEDFANLNFPSSENAE